VQLVRHRRQLGLAFAAAHAVHAVHIRRLYAVTHPERPLPVWAAVGGTVAYAFVGAMAATSWDGAVRRLGPARWRTLHLVGGHVILGTFSYDFLWHAPVIRRRPDLFSALTAAIWALRVRADAIHKAA